MQGSEQTAVELTLDISVVSGREYKVVASNGMGEYGRTIPRELSANIREDMRLLRWKAIGLHDKGDALLTEVGGRISDLVFPPQNRGDWEGIVRGSPNRLRIRFEKGTEELLHLPWELLHVDGRFVLQHPRSHVVREIATALPRGKKPWELRVLHVSLGLDSSLRLDEERAAVLNALPDDCETTFLLNPPIDALEDVFAEIRPSVIMISGHGAYDDLADQHTIQTLKTPLVTEDLIALAGKYGCGLLLLWTCESARLGSGIVTTGAGKQLPADVISFTYPVRSGTAVSAASIFIGEIVAGRTTAQAVESIRDRSTGADVYSFFNVVHYHTGNEPFFEIDPGQYGSSSQSAPVCAGREEGLLMLESEAYPGALTTVLAPRGSDAASFLSHWRALKSQSSLGSALPVRPDQIDKYREKPSSDRWLIVDDTNGIANLEKISQQVVRVVAPDTFKPRGDEAVVVLRGIDEEAAVARAEVLFGGRIKELIEHPLLTIPAFLEDLARGLTPDQATAAFETVNRMPERYANLSNAGRLFASLIFMMRGEARLPKGELAEYANHLDTLRLDGKSLVCGLHECIAANIVFRLGARLILSPDFCLLGDKWFPSWRTDNIRMFHSMVAAFATVDYEAKELDVEMAQNLLAWAVAIGAWKEASLLCIRLSSWCGEQGTLSELEEPIRIILPHTDSEEKLILEGHLISILTSSGRYREALQLHRELEKRVRAFPEHDHEYFLNLIACLTQQIDCLVEMDRLADALVLWQEAADLLDAWPEPEASVRPRMLGQRANIRKDSGDHESALGDIVEAVRLAEKLPGLLHAELRATKAEILWKMRRDDEADAALRIIAPLAAGGMLRSRYLHLKGILMERRGGSGWIEHVLESLEYDRQRGDIAGIAISLITLARIFIDQNDIERAKQRLREAFPYVQQSGLQSIMGVFARLWGEAAVSDGSVDSARAWLKQAIKAFDADGQTNKANDVRRILDRL